MVAHVSALMVKRLDWMKMLPEHSANLSSTILCGGTKPVFFMKKVVYGDIWLNNPFIIFACSLSPVCLQMEIELFSMVRGGFTVSRDPECLLPRVF
jgi:hypothetical protein